jgi:hypothetical protein
LDTIEARRDPPKGNEMRRRGGSEQPVKGRPANRPKARTLPSPAIADLQKQVGILTGELKEALERQTSTSDAGERSRICGANFGRMDLYEAGSFRPVAHYNVPAAYAASLASTPFKPHPQGGLGTVARTHEVVHIDGADDYDACAWCR